jgi:hypothetical protein
MSNTLVADISPTDTSLSLTGPFLTTDGVLAIGSEQIAYAIVAGSYARLIRGFNGTTAAAHTAGDSVTLVSFPLPLTLTGSTYSANPSVVDSAPTVGGAAVESVAVAGLLTTSTIWAVTQRTVGGSSLPLVGWTNTIPGHLNVIYSADMGVGAVVRVLFIH